MKLSSSRFKFNEEYPKLNKRHARGTGARRSELPNYVFLGNFDLDFKKLCLETLYSSSTVFNDIKKDSYNMSKASPLCDFFPSSYKQVLIQGARTSGLFEEDYVIENYPQLIGELKSVLNGLEFYRARFSLLQPGEVLDWHIDTDTSVSCRLHLILTGDSSWCIKRRQEIESKNLEHNEIWFTNTGWPHKVTNNSDEVRVVLNVGCSYEDLESAFGDIRLKN